MLNAFSYLAQLNRKKNNQKLPNPAQPKNAHIFIALEKRNLFGS